MVSRFLLLALLALVTPLLSPPGYMPAGVGPGGVQFRICPSGLSDINRRIGSGMDHHGVSDHDDDGSAQDCPFSLAGHAALFDPPVLILPQQAPAMPAIHVPAPLTGIFPGGLPPATGPPAS